MGLSRIGRRFGTFLVRLRDDTRGVALVELAIALPVLVLFLFGTIAWGYTMTLNDAMYDAARQGARLLAVNEKTEAETETIVAEFMSRWPTDFTVVAEVSPDDDGDVSVTISNDNILSEVFAFIPLPTVLSAKVVMRKEPRAS